MGNTKLANPAPLGLMGFGMTTILLNLHNVGQARRIRLARKFLNGKKPEEGLNAWKGDYERASNYDFPHTSWFIKTPL